MLNRGKRQIWPLLALVLSLSGCATQSQFVSVPPPKIPPPPPELMVEPDLSQTYSDIVQKLLLDWHRRLTDWKRSS